MPIICKTKHSVVLDSATAIGEDTPSIFIVTNNDNDSHGSAQVQDVLADVLSILYNTQSQNTKANEELVIKLAAEIKKLADRLTEQLQHKITKVTKAIYLSVDRRNTTRNTII